MLLAGSRAPPLVCNAFIDRRAPGRGASRLLAAPPGAAAAILSCSAAQPMIPAQGAPTLSRISSYCRCHALCCCLVTASASVPAVCTLPALATEPRSAEDVGSSLCGKKVWGGCVAAYKGRCRLKRRTAWAPRTAAGKGFAPGNTRQCSKCCVAWQQAVRCVLLPWAASGDAECAAKATGDATGAGRGPLPHRRRVLRRAALQHCRLT